MALDFLSDNQLHVHSTVVFAGRKFKQICPRMKGQEIYPLGRWPLEYPDFDVKKYPSANMRHRPPFLFYYRSFSSTAALLYIF